MTCIGKGNCLGSEQTEGTLAYRSVSKTAKPRCSRPSRAYKTNECS